MGKGELPLSTRLVSAKREDIRLILIALGAAGAAISGAIAVLYHQWTMALVLALLLGLWVGLASVSATIDRRLAILFSLLAVADYLKRVTFLAPDQSPWSQHLISILPTLYYGAAILVPALPRIIATPLSRVERLALIYLALALAMTWLSPGPTLLGRLAASGLLVLPWTMILVAARWGWEALPGVSRTMVFWGVLSALYGLWLFSFGPTPVELRWAESATFSIGARHLIEAMGGEGVSGVWRVTGLQPDAFTFGLFLLTALIGLEALAARGEMSRLAHAGFFGLLLLGIGLSLVRTIWVALVVFIVMRWIAEHSTLLRHPRLISLGLVGMFLLAPATAAVLYQRFGSLAGVMPNPLLARMLTFGTLEARKDALAMFLDVLPERLVTGLGYGISPWVTGKFGSMLELPPDFAEHNAFVEQLWYVGLPGLLLFVVLLYEAFARLARRYAEGNQLERQVLAILAAGLLALFTTGLGNGSVFLSYPFFFLLGVIVAKEQHDLEAVSDGSAPTARARRRP